MTPPRVPKAIGYVRVSTVGQGRSGLGLEAQRDAIQRYAEREGLELLDVYTEVETGSGADALERRPQLDAALRHARKLHVPVIVAKLDRLSRDVHFVSGLMAQRVEFICADLGRQSDPFVLHLYAALAEKERAMIAERTRVGLAAARRRGQRLGTRAKPKAAVRAQARLGGQARAEVAEAWAEANRWAVEAALREAGSFQSAARLLNERGVRSPRGGQWHASSVRNVALRLGLARGGASR